ncbi:MAG TPA: hypothetical protein VFT22_25480, partial [Kofleriaceae bacterium]|nr:hypothetical protein [Kofleriaceae bacterium]
MSDRQQQDNAVTTATSTAVAHPGPQQQSQPAVARVQALLASGRRELAAIASIVQSEPSAQAPIMMLLQQTLGNRFVHAVLDFVTGGGSGAPSAAPAEHGTSDGPVRVLAHGLHVRGTPSTASSENIVGNLHHGAVVTAIGHEGEWVKIEHGGKPAFVHGHYVEPVKKPAPAATAKHAHVHAPAHAEPAPAAAHAEPAPAAAPEAAPAAAPSSVHVAPPHESAREPAHSAPAQPAHPHTAPPATAHAPAPRHDEPAHQAPAAAPSTSAAPARPGEPISVGDDKVKPIFKKHGSGFAKYGGGTVKSALIKLVESGHLKLTGAQIAQLDAIAQVETGGQIACVQTYDNQKISMGFKQVVLGYGSLEQLMLKAPAGFAKHGLSLDMSAVYTDVKGGTPHQISGAPDSEMLRSEDWGNKFFAASMESDVIAAMCDLVLADAKKVDTSIHKNAGGIANFDDPTARAWLLEVQNNRPAFVPFAIKQAVSDGAKDAGTRDEFLDVLSRAIIKTYEVQEPEFAFKSARASKKHKNDTPEQLAALHKELIETLGPEGIKKGTNIVTKISRHIEIPKVAPGESVAATSAAPGPSPTAAIEHHASAPTPEHHDAPAEPVHAPAVHPDHHAQHAHPAQPAHAATPATPAPAVTPVVAPAAAPATSHHAAPATDHAAAPQSAQPAPQPVPATPATGATSAAPAVASAVTAAGHIPGVTDARPHVGDKALHTIVQPGKGLPSVYVSVPPGGVTGAVEVFLFLHGMYAHEAPRKDMPIHDPNPEEAMNLAGAMANTKRNLVTLAPIAKMVGDYPQWKDLEQNNDGYKRLILGAIANLPADAHNGDITVGSISIAGHSAGGQALGEAAEQLGDQIHDMTMEDGGYGDNTKKHPGAHAWKDSHAKVVQWLLSGKTDKLLRVLLHGEDNHGEGHVLDSNLNVDSLTDAANKLGLAGIKVTKEVFAKHEKRSVPTMYLDHKLHITGLPATRTVSVFNMPGSNHMAVRNLSTQALIEEDRDTEFVASGQAPSTGTEAAPKHHAKHASTRPAHADHAAQPAPAATAEHAQPAATTAAAAPQAAQDHPTAAPAKAPEPAAAPAAVAAHAAQPAKSSHKHGGKADKPHGPQPGDVVFADLTDLDQMVAAVHDPHVAAVAQAVHAVNDKSRELTATQLDRHELKGPARVQLLGLIRTTHDQIKSLAGDVDPAKLAAIKSRMFRALQEVSPYHEQARNIDILENNSEMATRGKTGDKTRTCNITSLGMALEGLGRGANDYTGSKEKVVAAAKHFQVGHVNIAEHGDLQSERKGDTEWDTLVTLRLPDFLELTAIAHFMDGTSEASVLAGADLAWGGIKQIDKLADLAREFGVGAEVKYFSFDPTAPAVSKGKSSKTKAPSGTKEDHGTDES